MTLGEEIASLRDAFEQGAGELGFADTAWLFVERVAELRGEPGVVALRDLLGQTFPTLHFVASRYLSGGRREPVDVSVVAELLRGTRRVLIVGLEAAHLDALVQALPRETRIGLLTYRLLPVDWDRVLSNHPGRVEAVDLTVFQTWAGARSAILTFTYGRRAERVYVLPAFARISGADVRTQFRDLVGWDVLGGVPAVYPRWLIELPASELTRLVEPAHMEP